jgi:hypothetical protein
MNERKVEGLQHIFKTKLKQKPTHRDGVTVEKHLSHLKELSVSQSPF